MQYTQELLERYWAKVEKADGCWAWTGAKTIGYGRFKVGARLDMAHRVAWRLAHGEIPEGLVVDHMCFNRGCVNPAHLRLLTRSENSAIHPPWTPRSQPVHICPRGHDKRRPNGRTPDGHCRECAREDKRNYMRRIRAAAKAA